MEKKYFALIFLMVVSWCNAQIINFPDPNFKARLLAAAPGLQIAYGIGGSIKIDTNNDGEIQVSEALMVTGLWLYNANINNIGGLENFVNLREINCYGNSIATMDLSPLTQLTRVNISNNHITSLNVTGLSQVEWLNCHFNELTSLDLTGMTYMYQLQCQNNQLTALNISNASNLLTVYCQNNLLTNLSTENIDTLYNLNCSSNNLIQLSLKNNYAEINLDFSVNPNLQYICADDIELEGIQNKINQYGYTSCYANSNCDFIPGSPVYFIEGVSKYDELNDGCDNADISYPNLRFTFSDGTSTGNVYSNIDGEFNTASQSTLVTITPQLENPAYFIVTPISQTVTLSDTANPLIQNFCVTPNGLHPDLEVSIARTNQGFSAYNYYYILTYKNIGTNTQSGNISLTFDDNQQNFMVSTPAVESSATNLLTWNFLDLKPFETRTIQIEFYMNLGTTLNNGDILTYITNIATSLVDETPNNNIFTLNEIYWSAVLLNNPSLSFTDYFAFYPNPTHDLLNIKTKNDMSVDSIAVYNLLGQSILQLKNLSNDSAIDVSGLGIGTYIIKIFSDKGIFTTKFMKN